MIWFTSDTHFYHANICRGTSKWGGDSSTRDFATIEDMNKTILNGINSRVKENDILYHLGDFCFGSHKFIPVIRESIICKDIRLIYGNHDGHIIKEKAYQDLFTYCRPYMEIREKFAGFVLFHYPLVTWNKVQHGSIMLHGHCHNNLKVPFERGRTMDVGVDTRKDYSPYSLDEIVDTMKNKEIVAFDHHRS